MIPLTSRAILCSKLVLLAGGEVPLLIIDGEEPKICRYNSVIIYERSMETERYSGRHGREPLCTVRSSGQAQAHPRHMPLSFAAGRIARIGPTAKSDGDS